MSMVLNAQRFGEKPYLTLSSHNDNWGGGFTTIKDDFRSFGLAADFQTTLYGSRVMQGTLSWNGFTNRYGADSSRVDEIKLHLRLPVMRLGSRYKLDALVGGGMAGAYGGQDIQNKIHELASSRRVDFPYTQQNQPFAYGGLLIWGQHQLYQLSESLSLQAMPAISSTLGAASVYTLEASVHLTLQNVLSDQITLGVGYLNQRMFPDRTYEAVFNAERGLYLDYNLRLGALHFGIKAFPQNRFSYGTLGITLLNWKGRSAPEHIDYTVELGWFSKAQGFFIRQLWNELTPGKKHFLFDLHYQSWELMKGRVRNYPDRLGHFHQISFGGYYQPIAPKNKWQLLPYVSARIGYKQEKTYGGKVAGPTYTVWSVPLIGEGGIKLKLPARLMHKNCYYGITGNYQYVHHLAKDEVASQSAEYTFTRNLGYFGAGGFVMIDF
jgi:hypothetical protein